MSDPRIKLRTVCRVCGTVTQPYLNLGEQALANALRKPDDPSPEFKAPLSVAWCPECRLSQLEFVVDPRILYADYPFRAGVSRLWQSHCAMLMTALSSPGRKFLLDIGSNDGTLLREGVDRGWKVLGVDPTPIGDLPSLPVLWSSGVARRVARLHGQADIVTATNVFGHVDDAKDFLAGIALVLRPYGMAIIECPHILPLLAQTAFDTIYHEHLSYWSLRPLERLADSVGLTIVDVQSFPKLHGGTMRYVLRPSDEMPAVRKSVDELRRVEEELFAEGITPYTEFAENTKNRIASLQRSLVGTSRRIWGYGASAKGAVLLQAADLGPETIECIVDDTPEKQGLLMPGSHIPIVAADNLWEPDVILLLSWNNAADLKSKAREQGFRGRFVMPHG